MKMRTAAIMATMILGLSLGVPPALAQVQAKFIDGAYTMSVQACDKLKALTAGTPRSVATVPWSVSAKGFDYGEGGCAFSRIAQRQGLEWSVTARCTTHSPEKPSPETYIFKRTGPNTLAVRLTTPGTSKADARPVVYTRCTVGNSKRTRHGTGKLSMET